LGPAVFAASYAAAISPWRWADTRFLLPLLAVLLLLAAAAAARVRWTSAGWGRMALPVLLTMIAAAPGARELTLRAKARGTGDTRLRAAEWIRASLPPTASFALERSGPEIDDLQRVVYWIPFHSVVPHVYDHAYHLDWYRGFDYVVVNEAMESRYASDARGFAPQIGFYLDLAREAALVKTFEPEGGTGPAIAIYDIRSNDLRSGSLDSLLAAAPRTQEMSDFLNGLGAAYSHLGRAAVAATMQRRALDISPGDARIYGNLGATYIAAGQPDAALEVLKEGVQRFPEVPELRYNLGNAYRSKRIDERAAMEYEAAIRLEPSLADAHLNLAQAYTRLGRYPEACAALETYMRLVPDSPREPEILEAIQYLRSHPAPLRPAGGG
jgi:tetratricopeptide (TPR) repeat protein